MPAGSLQEIAFGFVVAQPGNTVPWPITGATWEYVVRTSATDTGSPLITVTTSANSDGVLTVTDTATESQVLLSLYPAATATLAGVYAHALWMNPGTPNAYAWFGGDGSQLMIDANPQP